MRTILRKRMGIEKDGGSPRKPAEAEIEEEANRARSCDELSLQSCQAERSTQS